MAFRMSLPRATAVDRVACRASSSGYPVFEYSMPAPSRACLLQRAVGIP